MARSTRALSPLRPRPGSPATSSVSTPAETEPSGSRPLPARNAAATLAGVCASRSTALFIRCMSSAVMAPDSFASTAERLEKVFSASDRTSGAASYTGKNPRSSPRTTRSYSAIWPSVTKSSATSADPSSRAETIRSLPSVPSANESGGASGDAVAAQQLRQAVGGPLGEVLVDREGERPAEAGQVTDRVHAELPGALVRHHDGVVVRETELARHLHAERIEQALHDLRRRVSIARRRLAEEDQPRAVVLGIDVDHPLLRGLHDLRGRPVWDMAFDRDPLVLRELRDHLGEDHALREWLGADPQALLLIRTAGEERAEHDGLQAK